MDQAAVLLLAQSYVLAAPLRPELQLTHSNRGQPGGPPCQSLLVSEMSRFRNNPAEP